MNNRTLRSGTFFRPLCSQQIMRATGSLQVENFPVLWVYIWSHKTRKSGDSGNYIQMSFTITHYMGNIKPNIGADLQQNHYLKTFQKVCFQRHFTLHFMDETQTASL